MSQPRHSVSVAAVITDDHDRALVIQRRDNGAWQHPAASSNSTKQSTTACVAKSKERPASPSNPSD